MQVNKKILIFWVVLAWTVSVYAMNDGQIASTLVGSWQGPNQVWSFTSNGAWSVLYANGVQGRGNWVVRGGALHTHWVSEAMNYETK
jgi:hypothetical protein